MNDQQLVTIITHLTSNEADRVKSVLYSANIPFLVSGHHSRGKLTPNLFYLIKVEAKHLSIAKQIVARQRAKIFIDSRKCPKCKNLGYTEIEKKGFWKKLFYVGTTLVKCNKCNQEFSV